MVRVQHHQRRVVSVSNWSDGDGGCDCPSGHYAGLGRHRQGAPGCVSEDAANGRELARRMAASAKKHPTVRAKKHPTVRAQLLLTPEDAANGRDLARRMGVSFSAWVRIQIREAWRAEQERV